jgi:hypothetical protein
MKAWQVRLGRRYRVGEQVVHVSEIRNEHPTDGSRRRWRFRCRRSDGSTVDVPAGKIKVIARNLSEGNELCGS